MASTSAGVVKLEDWFTHEYYFHCSATNYCYYEPGSNVVIGKEYRMQCIVTSGHDKILKFAWKSSGN